MIQKIKKLKSGSLVSLVQPYRWKAVGLAALMLVQSFLQVAVAFLTKAVIDAALTNSEKLTLWGALLLADMLAMVLTHMAINWYSGSAADTMVAGLRQKVLRSALYSRDGEMLAHHSGQLLSRGLEDVQSISDGVLGVFPSFVGQITRLIAVFAAVLVLAPPIAGVLFVAAVVIGVAAAFLRPVLKEKHRKVRETDEKTMATMQESLQQLELLQSLDAQETALARFGRRLRRGLNARFGRRLWMVGSNGLVNAVAQLSTGLLLLWGAGCVADQTMSYGALAAMLQLLSLARGPVLGLSGLWTRLAGLDVAAERLSLLLHKEPASEPMELPTQVKAVVFEKVTFTYPGDEVPVLENFNACFPLNNWACLTGISGKGKTTIFKLILGLHTPQSGRIYLETEKGAIPCAEATRYLFAYVPQDYTLLSGTVLDNLKLVAPKLEEQQLRQALTVADADFIWDLPDREKTQVRENNAGLSKGQLQRLAIARAVLMERPILLLDECTSALDAAAEEAVLHNLAAMGKQAIVVTHRPAALEQLPGVMWVSMEQ